MDSSSPMPRVLLAAAIGLQVVLSAEPAEARPTIRYTASAPAMTLEACLDRARKALDGELMRVGAADAYSVTGASPTTSVVISCTPTGQRVQVEVFTAADQGRDPVALHSRLVQALGGDAGTRGAATSAGATAGTAGDGASSETEAGATGGAAGVAGSTARLPAGSDAGITLTSDWHLVREAAIRRQNDKTIEGSSVRQCLAACEDEPKCQSVEFHRSLGRCVLGFRAASNTVNTFHQHVCTDYYSRDENDKTLLKKSVFAASVPPEHGTWRKTPEAVVYGRSGIIREMEGSVIACADACDADASCKSFNHYPNYPKCHLLKITACDGGNNFWGNGTSALYHYTKEGSRVFVEAAGTAPVPLDLPAATDRTAATTTMTGDRTDPPMRFSTNFGDLIFRSLRPGPVTAQDPTGVGTIVGDLNGTTLIGRWLRNDAGQRCATGHRGSRNWGHIELRFDDALSRFVGRFGFCDGELETTWTGDHQAEEGAPPAGVRVAALNGWTVDFGPFEITGDQIDAKPAGDGHTSYYLAPGDFIGDWSGYGALAFEKKSWGGRYYGPDNYGASGDVIIESGRGRARFDIAEDHSGEWQSYQVPLSGSGWTVTGAESLGAILSNVTDFKIRAEYGAGEDFSGLRKVRLTP